MYKLNIWESPENNHQEVKINEQSSTITDRNYVSHGFLRTSKSLVGKKYKFLQSIQFFFSFPESNAIFEYNYDDDDNDDDEIDLKNL